MKANIATPIKWEKLRDKIILFGHQSVGQNIIDALHKIVSTHENQFLNISAINHPESIEGPGFYHFRVGRNCHPTSKNNSFASFLDNGDKKKIDVAFYKFCYVDVDEQTNIERIFASYQESIERLKIAHAKTTFIHVSIPLVVVQSGPRAWVKKIIRRKIGGYNENIKRIEYNKLLLKAYEGKDPLFDLARYQSTKLDGSRMQFTMKGKKYFSLDSDYASDGRHLNIEGSNCIAQKLLDFLVDIVS